MAVTGGLAAVGALAYGVYSGQQSQAQQKKALARQEQAQKDAEAKAVAQQRRAEQAAAEANKKQPDLATLLTKEQQAALQGPGSTMLTGTGGVDQGKLKLGKTTLLGGY